MKEKIFSSMIIFSFVVVGVVFSQKNERVAGKCMTCHKEVSTGLYKQWFESAHGEHNVTCIDCHGASKSDRDAFTHYDATIATLVTPKDCGNCQWFGDFDWIRCQRKGCENPF